MKRRHWLLVGAAGTLLVGWLLWNVLLVEKDLSPPVDGSVAAPGSP